MKYLVALALVALSVIPACAQWDGAVGEDPMTDQKWAVASAAFSQLGTPEVLFKCWDGGSLKVAVFVGRYEDAANYSSSVPVRFRVDKDVPILFDATPVNVNGFLALVVETDDHDSELFSLVKDIRDSKQRVALDVNGVGLEVGVQGTSKAFGTMTKLCKLDPVAPSDQAAQKPLTSAKP